MIGKLRRSLGNRRGISSIEYALLLAVVGGGITVGAVELTKAVKTQMEESADCIAGSDTTCEME